MCRSCATLLRTHYVLLDTRHTLEPYPHRPHGHGRRRFWGQGGVPWGRDEDGHAYADAVVMDEMMIDCMHRSGRALEGSA